MRNPRPDVPAVGSAGALRLIGLRAGPTELATEREDGQPDGEHPDRQGDQDQHVLTREGEPTAGALATGCTRDLGTEHVRAATLATRTTRTTRTALAAAGAAAADATAAAAGVAGRDEQD